MKALQRPGRVAAMIGAVAAVSASSMIALVVGTASAAEPAKCVDNVNVREQPKTDSKVVALCQKGTTVEAGEVRNGFVRLNDLGGWASQEYISINGQKPTKPGTATGAGGSGTTSDGAAGPRSTRPEGGAAGEGTGSDAGKTPAEEGTAEGTGPHGQADGKQEDGKPKADGKPQAKPAKPGPLGGLVPSPS